MAADKELRYRISNMAQILTYSNSLLKDSKRMLITLTSEEFSFINRNRFLRKVQSAFFELAIIELCKLFAKGIEPKKKSQRIKNHFSFEQVKILFKDKIEQNISAITQLEDHTIIRKIDCLRELRDQHFAHSDLDIEYDTKRGKKYIHQIGFYFTDADDLMDIAEKIIIEMYDKLLGQHKVAIRNNETDAEIFLTNHIKL